MRQIVRQKKRKNSLYTLCIATQNGKFGRRKMGAFPAAQPKTFNFGRRPNHFSNFVPRKKKKNEKPKRNFSSWHCQTFWWGKSGGVRRMMHLTAASWKSLLLDRFWQWGGGGGEPSKDSIWRALSESIPVILREHPWPSHSHLQECVYIFHGTHTLIISSLALLELAYKLNS